MSELHITLANGDAAIAQGLPNQVAPETTIATAPVQAEAYQPFGRESNATDAVLILGPALLLTAGLSWLAHRYRRTPLRGSELYPQDDSRTITH